MPKSPRIASRRRPPLLAPLLVALLATACRGRAPAPPTAAPAAVTRPLRVAAAADVEPAFVAIAERFQAQHRRSVVFSFGGSTTLAQQVRHGAPFDVYAAASVPHVQGLVDSQHIVAGSLRRYARGRLVLWTHGTPPPTDIAALRGPQYRRIALANPEHAPYGAAAVQALQSAGLYTNLRARLVYGENIRQAHQFVATGNADVALDAQSLALASGQPFTPVPDALYAPLVQALGIVQGGDPAGAALFIDAVLSPEGQQILARFGFAAP